MKKYLSLFCLLLLPGCDVPAPDSRVQTHDLLEGNLQPVSEVSTEVIHMSLATREHLLRLADIVVKDPPSVAELGCPPSDILCLDARNILKRGGVPVRMTGGGKDARLIYEYVVTSHAPPSSAALAPAPALMPAAASPPAPPVSRLPAPSLLLQSTPR